MGIVKQLWVDMLIKATTGSPGDSLVKNPPVSAGDLSSVPGSARSPGEGNEMAAHSSIPAWEIPWTEEPGGLQSMGLERAGHDWVTKRSENVFENIVYIPNSTEILCSSTHPVLTEVLTHFLSFLPGSQLHLKSYYQMLPALSFSLHLPLSISAWICSSALKSSNSFFSCI